MVGRSVVRTYRSTRSLSHVGRHTSLNLRLLRNNFPWSASEAPLPLTCPYPTMLVRCQVAVIPPMRHCQADVRPLSVSMHSGPCFRVPGSQHRETANCDVVQRGAVVYRFRFSIRSQFWGIYLPLPNSAVRVTAHHQQNARALLSL